MPQQHQALNLMVATTSSVSLQREVIISLPRTQDINSLDNSTMTKSRYCPCQRYHESNKERYSGETVIDEMIGISALRTRVVKGTMDGSPFCCGVYFLKWVLN